MEQTNMNSMWKMVLTVLVTALVIGGGTYWYVNDKATTDKAALQTTIDGLNANVTALNKKVADLTPSTTTTPSTPTTTDPTADWKTYANSTYSYSFKYPTNWEVAKVSPGPDNEYLLSWQGAYVAGHREDFLASVEVSPKTVSEEVTKEKSDIASPNNSSIELLPSESVTFNTYSATTVRFKNKSNGFTYTEYILSHGGKTFIITGSSDSTAIYEKVAPTIVNSFKFAN
jgi:hypothetical protein